MLIVSNHCVNAIHSRVKDVPVHSEAVRGSLAIWRYCSTKAIKVDHLVCVVELKDISHTIYYLKVLVFYWMNKVETVPGLGGPFDRVKSMAIESCMLQPPNT